MIKSLILILIFSIGIFTGKLLFGKKNTINNLAIKESKIIDKKQKLTTIKKETQMKEKTTIKEVLPSFIVKDLQLHSIDTNNFTVKEWEDFKNKLFLNLLSTKNKKVKLTNIAILSNSINTLKFLKENGIEINILEKHIPTIFSKSNYKMIQYLLEEDLIPLDYNNKRNEDLLTLALKKNDYSDRKQLLKVLSEYNFDISNDYNKYARLSLRVFPKRKNEILENIDLTYHKENSTFSLLGGLVNDMKEDDINFLLEKKPDLSKDNSVLIGANWNKNVSSIIMQELIDNGANVNGRYNKFSYTPIMNAVKNSEMPLEKVEVLLKNGADLTLVDDNGKNVFDHLEMSFSNKNRKKEVKKLLEKYKK